MPKITPFLTFNDNAEQAVEHYLSIFPGGKVLAVSRYGDVGPGPKGQVMVIHFEFFGQELLALNGGPHFKFSEGMSLVVHCDTQEEIDRYVARLTADGGELGYCGWLKDKFGVSWQVTPRVLGEMMTGKDHEKSQRVTQALMQMRKIDLAALERACAARSQRP